ncbi:MAG: universal stress protein [Solirubrobacteraceae bacterium]
MLSKFHARGDVMFRNILVCVDGSIHADRALTEAIDLAEAERSRLTILTSVQRPPYWACTPVTAAGIEPLTVELASEAAATLEAAVARVPESIPVTKILSQEPIRDALMHRLRTGNHDLLVMGSRGRGAVSASVLGSVSHYVLNHLHIPVLIIRADEADEPAPEPAETEPGAAAAQTEPGAAATSRSNSASSVSSGVTHSPV